MQESISFTKTIYQTENSENIDSVINMSGLCQGTVRKQEGTFYLLDFMNEVVSSFSSC